MNGVMSNLNWVSIQEFIKEGRVALVPCGSTEQHGMHLPFTTDTDTAFEVCKRVAERTPVLVTPPVAFGIDEHHMDFPGTIFLSADTYFRVLVDIFSSLIHHGITKILVVCGHGENNKVIGEAIKHAYFKTDRKATIGMVHCMGIIANLLPEVKSFDVGHGDIRETSIMMALRPESVWEFPAHQPRKLSVELTENLKRVLMEHLEFKGCQINVAQNCADLTPTGAWGQLEGSNPELGQRILTALADYIAELVQELEKTSLAVPPEGIKIG